MNTILHFTRHSSYINPEGTVPGRIPGFHLGEEGKKRGRKIGEFFKGKPIKYIYTSPLERTYETANIIGQYLPKAKITHIYDLIEVDASLWQAYKYEELFTNIHYEKYATDPATKEVPENLNALAARMKKFTLKLCGEHKGEEIVCVSHSDPITALRLSLEGKPLSLLRTYHVSIGSITSFTLDENCKLLETQYTELK